MKIPLYEILLVIGVIVIGHTVCEIVHALCKYEIVCWKEQMDGYQ